MSTINTTKRIRWPRRMVALILVAVAGWLISSYAVARYFTSRRSPMHTEPVPQLEWASFSEQRLTTRDGQTIGTWMMPGTDNKPMVVLVHGHMGNRSQMLSRAKLFSEMGCGTLLLTMRAHGDSTGDLNDFGYGGRFDVIAAVEHLEKVVPGRKIILVGCSAGATAVCGAGSELGDRIHCIVMEEPFRDISTVVKRRTDLFLPPVISHIAYGGLLLMGHVTLPHYSEIAPIELCQKISPKVKVWILTGGKDNRAHPEEGQSIYEAIKTHAEWVNFPEAGHESLLEHDTATYTKLAKWWVDYVMR
jgi:uncharacterized protein